MAGKTKKRSFGGSFQRLLGKFRGFDGLGVKEIFFFYIAETLGVVTQALNHIRS